MMMMVMVVVMMVCLQYDAKWVTRLSKRLVEGITSQLDHVVRNGDPEQTYHGEEYHTVCRSLINLLPCSLSSPSQGVSTCPLPMWRGRAY